MITIAICDDDFEFCKLLEEKLLKINNEINLKCQIDIYQNGSKLNKMILNGQHFDLLLLDIELNEIKGINIGETVRQNIKSENIYIIYISSKSHYAMDLFKTRPIEFLVKPIDDQKLKESMITFKELYFRNNNFFEYQYKKQYYKLTYDEILYFESMDRKTIIHLQNGEKEFYAKLKDIGESLNNHFIAIHKSYIVNINKIVHATYDYVVLSNGEKLNISQSRRQEVRKLFFEMKKTRGDNSHE